MRMLIAIFAASILLLPAVAGADTLRLASGAVIDGTYLGGNAREVRFVGPDGIARSYPITNIEAIEFGGPAPVATAAPKTAPARAAAPREASRHEPGTAGVTIPAGTTITVRLIDSIDAKETAIGERFRASIDDPIVLEGRTIIPRGADCTVQVMKAETGGRLKGSDELAIKLYDITVNGRRYDVATDYAQLKTKGEGKSTARNSALVAGLGAVIGGIAGGGKGAAIGAVAGAGAGAAGSVLKGPHLTVPSESRLTFLLRAPLPLD